LSRQVADDLVDDELSPEEGEWTAEGDRGPDLERPVALDQLVRVEHPGEGKAGQIGEGRVGLDAGELDVDGRTALRLELERGPRPEWTVEPRELDVVLPAMPLVDVAPDLPELLGVQVADSR